jgi:hypothetical protein
MYGHLKKLFIYLIDNLVSLYQLGDTPMPLHFFRHDSIEEFQTMIKGIFAEGMTWLQPRLI